MTDTTTPFDPFSKTVTIHAPASKAWQALTDPGQMKRWMLEEDITVLTDWKLNGPVTILGTAHWVYFENKGTVLKFEPGHLLRYSHLSSLSRLPDQPSSYSVIEFKLAPAKDGVALTLTLSNFPTESIYRHLVFYWNSTLDILKKFIEQPSL